MLVDIDDLITTTEIANYFKVNPSTVSNWKYRHDDFPKPLIVFKTNRYHNIPVYSLTQVKKWYKTQQATRTKRWGRIKK